MDAFVTQRCYICSAYFCDKVKLGLHIAVCYSDAVKRGVEGIPPPTDLLNDEKRYTEYMRDHHRHLQQIEDARKQKVSFVTADDFSAMKTRLTLPQPTPPIRVASAAPTAKPRVMSNAPIPSGSPAYRFRRPNEQELAGGVIGSDLPPPSRPSAVVAGRDAVAMRPDGPKVTSGVTMLKSELASEIANLKSFLEEEKAKARERDAVFHQGVHAPVGMALLPSAPALPSAPTLPSAPATPQGVPCQSGNDQYRCTSCGKTFGRKGFEVHTARCGKHATEDFTFSRDAERPESRKAYRIPDEPTRCQPKPKKQEFMVTYPRKVLNETQTDTRVPCSRCGGLFTSSAVAQHEAVCMSNRRR